MTDETVYVGSSDGHLYALNRDDGSQRWRYAVGQDIRVWTSPAATHGIVLFGSHAGDLVALTTRSDKTARTAQAKKAFVNSSCNRNPVGEGMTERKTEDVASFASLCS